MDVRNWKPHVRGVERAARNGVSGFRGGDRLGDAASVPGGNDDCPRCRSACKGRQRIGPNRLRPSRTERRLEIDIRGRPNCVS